MPMPDLSQLVNAAVFGQHIPILPQGARMVLNSDPKLWGATLFGADFKVVRREPRAGDILVCAPLLNGEQVGLLKVYQVGEEVSELPREYMVTKFDETKDPHPQGLESVGARLVCDRGNYFLVTEGENAVRHQITRPLSHGDGVRFITRGVFNNYTYYLTHLVAPVAPRQ